MACVSRLRPARATARAVSARIRKVSATIPSPIFTVYAMSRLRWFSITVVRRWFAAWKATAASAHGLVSASGSGRTPC
jgi:hypothetical protein